MLVLEGAGEECGSRCAPPVAGLLSSNQHQLSKAYICSALKARSPAHRGAAGSRSSSKLMAASALTNATMASEPSCPLDM